MEQSSEFVPLMPHQEDTAMGIEIPDRRSEGKRGQPAWFPFLSSENLEKETKDLEKRNQPTNA